MMSGVDVEGLSQYSLFKAGGEDAASLLTSSFTFYGLVLTAAFLSWTQLIGQPIECWCPAQITDAMCNYTKSICWVSRLYVIDFDEAIPTDTNERREAEQGAMMHYAMVPFIILLLALILKTPTFLWSSFQGEEGLNIVKAVRIAVSGDHDDDQIGQDIATEINFSLTKTDRKGVHHPWWQAVKRVVSAAVLFPMGGDIGTYQTGLFLFSRLLSIVLIVLVYPGLGYALQMDFARWGWDVFRWGVFGDEMPQMSAFPREALCDFHVRQMQNLHAYTVQCVLPINMWSEKVFIVLWPWLLFLLLASIYSYQYWVRKMLLPSNRLALVTKHLTVQLPNIKKTRRKDIDHFASNYLTFDSILVLRILEMEAGNRLATVVVGHLWTKYNCREDARPR